MYIETQFSVIFKGQQDQGNKGVEAPRETKHKIIVRKEIYIFKYLRFQNILRIFLNISGFGGVLDVWRMEQG